MKRSIYITLMGFFVGLNAAAEPSTYIPFSYVQTAKQIAKADEMDLNEKAPSIKSKPARYSQSSLVKKDLNREQIRNIWKDLPNGKGEFELRYLANAEERNMELSNLRQQKSSLIAKINGANMQLAYKDMLEENPKMVTAKLSPKTRSELTAELAEMRLKMTTLDSSITALQNPSIPFEKIKKVSVSPSHSSAALEAFDKLEKEGRVGLKISLETEAKAASKTKGLGRVLPGTTLFFLGASLGEAILGGSNANLESSTSAVAADR